MPKEILQTKSNKKVKGAVHHVRNELRNRTSQAIITAYALIIALAWQDAIKEVVTRIADIFQVPQNLYFYKIISALFLTLICVIGITIVSRSLDKEKS